MDGVKLFSRTIKWRFPSSQLVEHWAVWENSLISLLGEKNFPDFLKNFAICTHLGLSFSYTRSMLFSKLMHYGVSKHNFIHLQTWKCKHIAGESKLTLIPDVDVEGVSAKNAQYQRFNLLTWDALSAAVLRSESEFCIFGYWIYSCYYYVFRMASE